MPSAILKAVSSPRVAGSRRQKISLLLMVRELGPGGTERQLAELARSLDPGEFEVTVGAFITAGPRAAELRSAGVRIEEFAVRSFRSPSLLCQANRLRSWLRRQATAIFHAFDYPSVLFGVPVARLAGVPCVLSSQRGERTLFSAAVQRLLGWTDRLVDGVVVNSQFMVDHLLKLSRLPQAKIHLCYNGIDTERFAPAAPLCPLGPPGTPIRGAERSGLVIGTVAVLRPEKDVGTLIDAVAGLPSHHRLVIVGDGPCAPELKRRAAALGHRCSFLGTVADPIPHYRAMDIFVLPSLSEAFSNSLLEAMACGCVPVVSDCGGNRELVSDGDNGLLFPPGDRLALTGCLQTLISQPALRLQMALRSRERVVREFALPRMAQRMASIYRQLLATA